jgi:methylthioribose-1-phosphate isomerase
MFGENFKTIDFVDGAIVLIDQRKLPRENVDYICKTPTEAATAITDLVVRGAPAIGVTAAYAMAIAAADSDDDRNSRMNKAAKVLIAARPTASNLKWAVDLMLRTAAEFDGMNDAEFAVAMLEKARTVHEEDVQACRNIGKFGAEFVPDNARLLTICNAGALATAGYGTALGVVRGAIEAGKKVEVFACETRPFLQGARLTTWELVADKIDVTLITDNMAGHLFSQGQFDLVVAGADRIAANGDSANKIGTYALAVLARYHKVPFYIAAPLSTIDLQTSTGKEIPIEERSPEEVLYFDGKLIAAEGAKARYPAFDVTPAELITAIITDRGNVKPISREAIAALFE